MFIEWQLKEDLPVGVHVLSDAAADCHRHEYILRGGFQHLQHRQVLQHALTEARNIQEHDLTQSSPMVSERYQSQHRARLTSSAPSS